MPSINDDFADAIAVDIATNGGTYTSASLDTNGNTTETNEPTVSASDNVSAWWSYTPTSSGTATFDTQLSTPTGSGTDTYMAIWTGTNFGDMVNVAADDDSGGSGTSLISGLSVTSGTTYWVQVGGFGLMTMNLVLRVTGPATGSSPDGTVNAVTATATAEAPIPTVTGTSPGNVNAVVATATAAAILPAVSGGGGVNGDVDAITATMTAEAIEPEVSGETILSGGGAATATMQAHAPAVSGGDSSTVVAVAATASLAAGTPVVSATSAGAVVAVRATSSATMRAPAVTGTSPDATVVGVRAIATARARAPQVVAIEPTFFFSPPTHEEPMRTREKPLVYFRLTHALSVVRVNGSFVQIRTPMPEVLEGLEEGVDFFRGGYEYEVSRDTALELDAAGYTTTQL